MDTELTYEEKQTKLWIKRISYSIVGFLALIIILSSFTIIRQGEVGVVTRFGRATGREMNPGLNFKAPIIEGVTRFDTKIKRADANAGAGTKDLQTVNTSIVLNYHIQGADTSDIFSNLGDDDKLFDKVIYPAIQEVVKASFSQYKAEELLTKREEVKTVIDVKLSERLLTYWVYIDDISVTDITFSEEFDKAIEAKQVAEQEAQKAQYEKQKAITDKEAEVEKAKLDVEKAKAIAEQNRLQTKELSQQILQKMWLEKWDGKLPQVMGGDGSSLIYNLNK